MKDLLRYKDIILYRTLAGLKSEARKNYLGYIWFILEPLLGTGVFYFAMTHLTGQRGPAAVLTILVGMTAWQWFEGSVMLSANSITAKFHVHMQVPLPKYIFPMVDVGMNTVRFFFAFSLIIIAWWFLNAGPSVALPWLVLVLMLQLLFTISLSLAVSILVTLFSDLLLLLQSLFRLLFFSSGIFFTASKVPEHLLPYFYANPIAVFIESYREIILFQRAPNLHRLGNAALITLAILIISGLIQSYFNKRLLKLTNV
jgi:lipopolysaccharide transport system permease protein